MSLHPSVQQSFFIRFLLTTVVLGNTYLILQSLAHSINFHALDVYVRWYAFKAAPFYNLILLAGSLITFYGALRIFKKGKASFKIYFIGKLISLIAFIVLTIFEYKISGLPYPMVLLPVLVGIESLYPMVLYLSLRKSKARRQF